MERHDLILAAPLDIVHHSDDQGRYLLHYRPRIDDEDDASFSRSRRHELRRDTLKHLLLTLKKRVDEVLLRALAGQNRDGAALDDVLQELSRVVLPGGSLTTVLPADVHPVIDVQPESLLEIPWEGLSDQYQECRVAKCPAYRQAIVGPRGQLPGKFCSQCGGELTSWNEKLGILRYLCHRADLGDSPVSVPHPQPLTEGKRQFVLIADPTGDLCQADRDPTGECAEHIARIQELLVQAGFDVCLRTGPSVTKDALLDLIRNPHIDGIYYFGHAVVDSQNRETALLLANDERFYASEVEESGAFVRFVFINACEAASASMTFDSANPFRNFAQAFCSGSHRKTAIAPLWKVANIYAARAAVEFFQHAVSGVSFAEAIRRMRQQSWERYQKGEPDITWMAYRFFGRPHSELAASSPPRIPRSRRAQSRLFDATDRLDLDRFAFPMDEVLFRAAKRRNLQQRSTVSVADLFAGLIRRGALTRTILLGDSLNPDKLYQAFLEHGMPPETGIAAPQAPVSPGPVEPSASEKSTPCPQHEDPPYLRSNSHDHQEQMPEHWIVRSVSAFDSKTLNLLQRSELIALERGEDANSTDGATITERDLLFAFSANDEWALPRELLRDVPLPIPQRFVRQIEELTHKGLIDLNGRIPLDGLDPAATSIIHAAHRLATRCNSTPLRHRALLIAFLARSRGLAQQRAREQGVGVELLCALLLASLSGHEPPPTSVLGLEVAGSVVVHLLKHARREAQQQPVTEEILLKAFCQNVDSGWKDRLKSLEPPLRLDLDRLISAEPSSPDVTSEGEQFTPLLPHGDSGVIQPTDESSTWDVTGILKAAAGWAAVQRLSRYSLYHVAAALLAFPATASELFPALNPKWTDLFRRQLLLRGARRELIDLKAQSPNPNEELQSLLVDLQYGLGRDPIHREQFLSACRQSPSFAEMVRIIENISR